MLDMSVQGGQVYELYGHSGTGKTQLCLTSSARCLARGGNVVYIDTKGDFCADRFLQIYNSISDKKHNVTDIDLTRFKYCEARTGYSLQECCHMVSNMNQNIHLIIIDNISLPLMTPVVDGDIHSAITTGSTISQLLHKTAAVRNCAVILVSNLKSVNNDLMNYEPEPALGAVWNSAANVRLLMTRISDKNIEVCVTRGAKTSQKCIVTIDKTGLTDIKR